jgi:hypothetical protein
MVGPSFNAHFRVRHNHFGRFTLMKSIYSESKGNYSIKKICEEERIILVLALEDRIKTLKKVNQGSEFLNRERIKKCKQMLAELENFKIID